jgi:hypothetical protein
MSSTPSHITNDFFSKVKAARSHIECCNMNFVTAWSNCTRSCTYVGPDSTSIFIYLALESRGFARSDLPQWGKTPRLNKDLGNLYNKESVTTIFEAHRAAYLKSTEDKMARPLHLHRLPRLITNKHLPALPRTSYYRGSYAQAQIIFYLNHAKSRYCAVVTCEFAMHENFQSHVFLW